MLSKLNNGGLWLILPGIGLFQHYFQTMVDGDQFPNMKETNPGKIPLTYAAAPEMPYRLGFSLAPFKLHGLGFSLATL